MIRLFIVIAMSPVVVRSASFVTPTHRCYISSKTTMLGASEAEERLSEMAKAWTDLQKKEKEIERSHDENAAYELAKEMLETAIEFTQTKEAIEKEHAESAHKLLENAMNQEAALGDIEEEVHRDAYDADQILGDYKKVHLPEDVEKRREMTVAEISHNIENYVESRIQQANEAEQRAREEEEEAKRSLRDLERKEAALKATLEELTTLKPKAPLDE